MFGLFDARSTSCCRLKTAPLKVRPAAAYSSCQEYSSTRTAVVRSPRLVRPSGTHSATICAIQISASPASVAYLRRICFIIIIIERRDYGGVLSEDCEDTEQSSEKVSKVRETVLRTRNCQTRPKLSCRIASSGFSSTQYTERIRGSVR